MTLTRALAIVIELAEENALNPDMCDKDLIPTANTQREAINVLRDTHWALRSSDPLQDALFNRKDSHET